MKRLEIGLMGVLAIVLALGLTAMAVAVVAVTR
jgi:hypothetical protein